MVYCTDSDMLVYLPKNVRDVLLAEDVLEEGQEGETEYDRIVSEKIQLATDYVTFVLLMRKDYLTEVPNDIKMTTAMLSALYVIEYYIHLAPESMGIDYNTPNYKSVISNKINEMKNHIDRVYIDNNFADIEKSYFELFVPKDKEE
ncbi:MAG: hypothetical protein GYA14_14045 [Ignavibacteria bacterium]|nr:hypothetical protein [Ignavibacteria bacterium]